MNSVLQISCVTLEERFSIDCKGLSFNQFSFSHLDPVSLFLFPLGRILLCMTHTAFFLPRPAPVANYSRKVCFINLWYVWCLMVFIIGIRHFFIVLILVLGFPVNWRGFSLTSSEKNGPGLMPNCRCSQFMWWVFRCWLIKRGLTNSKMRFSHLSSVPSSKSRA